MVENIVDKTGFAKNASATAVESRLEIIKGSLEKGEDVMVSGFGKFSVKEKTERKGTSCSACQKACLFDAVEMQGTAVVKWEACMGCGVCVERCPKGARSLVRDERKGVPLDVRLLAQKQSAHCPITL